VLSGGMDSTTLLYHLLHDGRKVKAISFDYGQRHKRELEMASQTCLKLGVEHKIISLAFMRDIASNSALTSDMQVPHGHYEAENMKLTVVPNRNMIMASIAMAWAVNEEFDEIALGVHAGDHAIYPDCRPVFVDQLKKIAMIANFNPVFIYAPFLHLTKNDIAERGKVLNVDYSLTHTCYEGGAAPCGECGSCVERAEAFKISNMIDPLIK